MLHDLRNTQDYHTKTEVKKDLIPQEVYNALDWRRCAVGGSHALSMFDNTTWEPNDIDIFVAVTPEEGIDKFKEVIAYYLINTSSVVTRDFRTTQQIKEEQLKGGKQLQQEDFHKKILGVIEIETKGVSKTMQFVAFEINNICMWHSELVRILDAPSCMIYLLSYGKKYYTVGEKYGLSKLFGLESLICEARRVKYLARGYKL